MERHPNDLTTDDEIDDALEQAKLRGEETHIVEAAYYPGAGFEFLMMRLNDGRRLLVPKEELSELKNATAEQAMDLKIGLYGVSLWWPQLDDGLYLPDFLERRWRKPGTQAQSSPMRSGDDGGAQRVESVGAGETQPAA